MQNMADDYSSSDSDDEEYVPEGPPSSGSDVSDGDSDEYRPSGVAPKRRRSKPTRKSPRKRPTRTSVRRKRKGISLDSEHSDDNSEASDDDPSGGGDEDVRGGGDEGVEDVTSEPSDSGIPEEKKKDNSRIDDLWATFKQDVGMPSKQGKETTFSTVKSTAGAETASSKTVSIKKTYDFAGEQVEVEKQVEAGSKEAKKFFEASSDSAVEGRTVGGQAGDNTQTGTKRKGSGLNSVLQSIGKKQKLSTLEKSHLDWQKYKTDEGLEDELAHTNKDGYLAKQEFLQRADLRQFELERDERLKRFKRLH